jgi:hypothetical protein
MIVLLVVAAAEGPDRFGFHTGRRSPHGDGRPKTFRDPRPQRLQLERAAQQSPRRLCDHKASRFGQRLQSRGQIERLADDGLFLRRALSDKVADHNDPRGDTDADLEIFVRPRFELRDDGRDVEASPYRPLGVVLMGLGIPDPSQDRFSNSGSLAKMAAIRRASSRVSSSPRRCR